VRQVYLIIPFIRSIDDANHQVFSFQAVDESADAGFVPGRLFGKDFLGLSILNIFYCIFHTMKNEIILRRRVITESDLELIPPLQ